MPSGHGTKRGIPFWLRSATLLKTPPQSEYGAHIPSLKGNPHPKKQEKGRHWATEIQAPMAVLLRARCGIGRPSLWLRLKAGTAKTGPLPKTGKEKGLARFPLPRKARRQCLKLQNRVGNGPTNPVVKGGIFFYVGKTNFQKSWSSANMVQDQTKE